MDSAYAQLLTKDAFIAAILVVIGTFFVRKIVETAVPSAKGEDTPKGSVYKTRFGLWWNSVILYAIPVVFGAGVGALGKWTNYLVPEGMTTMGGAILWGVVVGWFSSFLYKVARKLLKDKTGVELPAGPGDDDKALTDEDKDEADLKAEEPVKAAPEAKDEAPAVTKDKPAE